MAGKPDIESISPKRITKLDETVVNRIAAGEVVQRPASAIKELIENSLDANSTSIVIAVKDGGLRRFTIVDNGTGICKDGLEILCERFTTSKLSKFEDLAALSTYGFRGEALSSISHVAYVTVITKTKDDPYAYKVSYVNGKWKSPPTPYSANLGTQIIVENLFYNDPVRLKMMKNSSEEYLKIVDVVSKYAVHNSGISFSLKKNEDSNLSVKTNTNATIIDNIRSIYGHCIARELMEVETADTVLQFEMKGYVTSLNYSNSKLQFLLFINHRLVESDGLKKELDQLYSTYLPNSGHPFIYMSLLISPQNIDVNVHPTKHSVYFLHEEAVIQKVRECVKQKLVSGAPQRMFDVLVTHVEKKSTVAKKCATQEKNDNVKLYDHSKVRTSSSEQKLEKFFGPSSSKSMDDTIPKVNSAAEMPNKPNSSSEEKEVVLCARTDSSESTQNPLNVTNLLSAESLSTSDTDTEKSLPHHATKKSRETIPENSDIIPKDSAPESSKNTTVTRRNFPLNSLQELRYNIESRCHPKLKAIVNDFTFIGCVNKVQSLIQHTTALYLCNNHHLSLELFYQKVINDFGNFGELVFSNPMPLKDLIDVGLENKLYKWSPHECSKDEFIAKTLKCLMIARPMLDDYFSIRIDNCGNLLSLPQIISNYVPDLTALPELIMKLTTNVQWKEEKPCFHSIAFELASFYAQPFSKNDVILYQDFEETWKWTVEHVIYSSLKQDFYPPEYFNVKKTFVHLVSLQQLYHVFERC